MTRTKTALLLASAALLAACGGPKTTDQLLIGEWDMAEPVVMTQAGQTMTLRDGETEYKSDGTTEGEVVMEMGEMAFKIETTGTYTLNGMQLTEKTTNAEVEVVGGESDMANQIAAAIKQQSAAGTASTSTIQSIDKDRLVINEPTTGMTMTFDRD